MLKIKAWDIGIPRYGVDPNAKRIGYGTVIFLAASSPENAGHIEWLALRSESPPEDRAWWNEHAYADGKLKFFYYEYPVLAREEKTNLPNIW